MKIEVEAGTVVRLDRRTSTSATGGIYDISRLSKADRARVLALPGVTEASPSDPDPLSGPEELEIDATDAARDRAVKHGIDLRSIEGTGENGRIVLPDIERAIANSEE